METKRRLTTRTVSKTPSKPRLRWPVRENYRPGRSPTLTPDNHHAENSNHRDCAVADARHRAAVPATTANRDSQANGAPWGGWRAVATAYRAPTRRRPLSPRMVGARPGGARAAVIASAEGPQLRAS